MLTEHIGLRTGTAPANGLPQLVLKIVDLLLDLSDADELRFLLGFKVQARPSAQTAELPEADRCYCLAAECVLLGRDADATNSVPHGPSHSRMRDSLGEWRATWLRNCAAET